MNRITITNMLKELGVSPKLYGYDYLTDAIELTLKDEEIIHRKVTKELYPFIAKKHNSTPSRVERAIRHAIQVAYDRGNIDILNKLFRYTISSNTATATNSEFIATVSDYLRTKYHGKAD